MGKCGLLRCAECDRLSGKRAEGWVALLTENLDGEVPSGVAAFCPACAGVHCGCIRRERRARRLDDQAGD